MDAHGVPVDPAADASVWTFGAAQINEAPSQRPPKHSPQIATLLGRVPDTWVMPGAWYCPCRHAVNRSGVAPWRRGTLDRQPPK